MKEDRMKRLADFKNNERIPRSVIKALPMKFCNGEPTRRIVLHHARLVILQHREELQKLAYK